MTKKEKVRLVLDRLYRVYPHPVCALHHTNPWELLVATMLSAQTTDKMVNQITPSLFAAYTHISAYASASVEDIDRYIKKINFHNTKAKNIVSAAQIIIRDYDGDVPQTMEALDALPGVARKTANVVLGNAFGIVSGIVVDTHVVRLSRKLGFTIHTDPVKIEKDLMKIVPKEHWISFSHLLILHGRDTCPARPHSCEACPLGDLCPCKKEKRKKKK